MAKKKKKLTKPVKSNAAPKKKKPAKRVSKAAPKRAPVAIDQIGREVVEHVNQKRPDAEIWAKWFSPNLVSVEGSGQRSKGIKNVAAKCAAWVAQNQINGCSADGPFVGPSGFAVKYRIDVTEKATGNRVLMEEIGFYSVKGGKVVAEEFLYGSFTPIATQVVA